MGVRLRRRPASAAAPARRRRRCARRGCATTTSPASTRSPCSTGWSRRDVIVRDGDAVALGSAGPQFFVARGIDVTGFAGSRRPVCRACLDWSVRRSHLAGAAGRGDLRADRRGEMGAAGKGRPRRHLHPGRARGVPEGVSGLGVVDGSVRHAPFGPRCPLHRLRRSPSPASQGRTRGVAAGRDLDPPPCTGEGDHAKRGGGGTAGTPETSGGRAACPDAVFCGAKGTRAGIERRPAKRPEDSRFPP